MIIIHHGNHDDDGFLQYDHPPRFKTLTLLLSWQDSLMSVFMGGHTGEGEHHNQRNHNNPHHYNQIIIIVIFNSNHPHD